MNNIIGKDAWARCLTAGNRGRRPSGRGGRLKLDSCADLQVAAADRGTTDCAGSLRPAGSGEIHRIVEVAVWGAEVRVIEDIGCIRAELQADALDDAEGLPYRRVLRIDTGGAERVSPRVAEGSICRSREGGWIIPLLKAFFAVLGRA